MGGVNLGLKNVQSYGNVELQYLSPGGLAGSV